MISQGFILIHYTQLADGLQIFLAMLQGEDLLNLLLERL